MQKGTLLTLSYSKLETGYIKKDLYSIKIRYMFIAKLNNCVGQCWCIDTVSDSACTCRMQYRLSEKSDDQTCFVADRKSVYKFCSASIHNYDFGCTPLFYEKCNERILIFASIEIEKYIYAAS